ncbi:MAG: trypsin-like peptidase domain-containing protein [Oscillospiraceae bacterium]|nr:trypsin-like peptidase domain-containing protein [Oscillospiraceae bacterium]
MYHEYPFENSDERNIPLDQSQYHVEWDGADQTQGGHQNRPVKKKRAGRVVALALAGAIVLGVAGGGIAYFIANREPQKATTLQVGSREPIQLNTMRVDTGKKLTLPEVYAANVNSTVGISTEVTTTNVFGQRVSGVAAGSGFILTEDGYILTNYHVVSGAQSIQVTMYDETKYSAQLAGYDEDNDIAVLKVEATGLQPVILGDSSQMNVGEAVMAIGNPLGELTFTYTTGIISALNRSVTVSGTSYNMIQTDCAINEGNSGGPLFNEYGEVIGIVSAKYASSEIEGLGFAIPINNVLELVQDIMENGRVTGKPSMGIVVSTVTESVANQYNLKVGACVNEVEEGSCAEAAGLRQGDIITAIGDKKITTADELIAEKKTYKAGETTTLTVYRNGESLTLEIVFDEEKQTTEDATVEGGNNQNIQGNNEFGDFGGGMPFFGFGF